MYRVIPQSLVFCWIWLAPVDRDLQKMAPRSTMRMTLLDKVWLLAQRMGYSNYYVNDNSSAIIDDHYYINETDRDSYHGYRQQTHHQ